MLLNFQLGLRNFFFSLCVPGKGRGGKGRLEGKGGEEEGKFVQLDKHLVLFLGFFSKRNQPEFYMMLSLQWKKGKVNR